MIQAFVSSLVTILRIRIIVFVNLLFVISFIVRLITMISEISYILTDILTRRYAHSQLDCINKGYDVTSWMETSRRIDINLASLALRIDFRRQVCTKCSLRTSKSCLRMCDTLPTQFIHTSITRARPSSQRQMTHGS